MSEHEASVSVPNALVFVECRDGGELPAALASEPVSATSSSIAIGTRHAVDGPTLLRILDRSKSSAGGVGIHLLHAQALSVPSGVLTDKNAYLEELVEHRVPRQLRVEVYVNDPAEPSDISVVFSAIE
jgi:hypothetical protein